MAVTVDFAMPFGGNSLTGDPGDQIGPYSAEDRNKLYRHMAGFDGDKDDRGLFLNTLADLEPACVPGNQEISVEPGAVLVRGVVGVVTATKTLTVPANGTGTWRKDLLIARRCGPAAQSRIELDVLTGTAAALPALTQSPLDDGIFEIPLWWWWTPFPFTDLCSTGTLGPFRLAARPINLANGSFAMLKNASGADAETGTIVVKSTSANSFDIPIVDDAFDILGVLAEPSANNEISKVILTGVTRTAVNGTVAIGDRLNCQAATAAIAGYAGVGELNHFAIALETNASGLGIIKTLVLPRDNTHACKTYRDTVISIPIGGWSAFNMDKEYYDTDNMHTGSNYFVIIQDPGIYSVEVYMTGAAVIQKTVSVWLNVATMLGDAANDGNSASPVSLAIKHHFIAGDKVEFWAKHASGSSAHDFTGWMSVTKVGDYPN